MNTGQRPARITGHKSARRQGEIGPRGTDPRMGGRAALHRVTATRFGLAPMYSWDRLSTGQRRSAQAMLVQAQARRRSVRQRQLIVALLVLILLAALILLFGLLPPTLAL
jgi:hypothetical protein